ncbi:hypothetical protein HJC23_006244 [Cyclotella cryptica]|uniref:Uncharacterized protein n=1 Tax=Cyclotella cryptica TaxID=29204 RepID=A0ABD3PN69_9STRA
MRFPSAINSIVKSLCPTPLFLVGTGKSASYSGSRCERTPPPSARHIPTRNRPSSRASNYADGNDDSRPVVAGANLVFGRSERDRAGAVPPIAVTVPVAQSLPESQLMNPFEDSQETHVSGTQLPPLPPPVASSVSSINSSGSSHSGSNYSTPKKTGSDDQVPSSSSSEESVPNDTPRSLIFFVDSEEYDGTYAAAEFSIHQRIMHFLRGRKIDHVTRQNVEICLLIEAGGSVTYERTTTVAVRNRMMLERYHNLLRGFSPSDFARPSLSTEMTQCLYNAKKDMTGDRLWKKFEDWRKELRTKYFPKLPKNLATIPSGHQLMDVYKIFVIHRFREEYVSRSSFVFLADMSTQLLILFHFIGSAM